MTLYVYVDNSNVWIEGMRVAAVRNGLATSLQQAMHDKITDQTWTYDFGKLYGVVCPDDEMIGRLSLFGSRPPENDSIWELARREGFQVHLFDRNFANKEKQVDVAIATQIIEDSFLHMKPGDGVVLVSGDSRLHPDLRVTQGSRLPDKSGVLGACHGRRTQE